jgi:hypothetical protein
MVQIMDTNLEGPISKLLKEFRLNWITLFGNNLK